MTDERWARELSGDGCPFCHPREPDNDFWQLIGALPSSSLYLSRDQRFAGRCLLIWDGSHAIGLGSLSPSEGVAMMADLVLANNAIQRATGCALMNVASLGNQIAHMHFHLIPRNPGDPRWGAPPWTTSPDEIPARHLPDNAFAALRDSIERELFSSP